jgi:hypothetical protein
MKTNAPALVRISLPSEILVPVDADFNAIMRLLGKARKLETCFASTDPLHAHAPYCGESAYFCEPCALPEIKPFTGTLHPTREAAQLAVNESTAAELLKREQATATKAA